MKFDVLWNICRICLTEKENLLPIDDKDANNIPLFEKISTCGGITIDMKMNMPEKICQDCLANLDIAYKFHTDCQNSDKILRTFSTNSNENIHIEDLDDSTKIITKNAKINDDQVKVVFYVKGSELLGKTKRFKAENNTDIECDSEDLDDRDLSENSNEKCPLLVETETNLIKKVDKTRPVKYKKTTKQYTSKPSKKSGGVKYKEQDSDIFMCEVCGNKYKKKGLLESHMRIHMDVKPFACEICGKRFAIHCQIKRHMRVHTGQKPFECKYCGRKFADFSSFLRHERTHTNERPYRCDECGKTFNYSHVLKKHMSVHTGEKPYMCELCGKSFARQHHLKFHFTTLSHQAMAQNQPKNEQEEEGSFIINEYDISNE